MLGPKRALPMRFGIPPNLLPHITARASVHGEFLTLLTIVCIVFSVQDSQTKALWRRFPNNQHSGRVRVSFRNVFPPRVMKFLAPTRKYDTRVLRLT